MSASGISAPGSVSKMPQMYGSYTPVVEGGCDGGVVARPVGIGVSLAECKEQVSWHVRSSNM